ncbi:hypothetical protein [Streptomyces sp. NPDC004230]
MHARTRDKRTARRSAGDVMRGIAACTPSLNRTPESICTRQACDVAWRGEENDCWSCGLPATGTYRLRGSALQRLLAQVGPGTRRKAVTA